MVKKVWIILMLFIFFISACSNFIEKESDDSEVNDKQENERSVIVEIEDDSIEEITDPIQPEPEYELNDIWSIVPISDDSNDKVVLLTIDDAPDNHALDMAKTLKELDANAIFFVNGHFLETAEEKEILKEIYDMGFLIGNHTYSHKSLPSISEVEQKEEMVRVNDLVEEVTGERPSFFRAPFGENTDYTRKVAMDEGMTLMNWSYGYDWEKAYMSQEGITKIMLETDLLSNGANLLMHDREWTALALHDIVVGLRDKGYEMVDPVLIKSK